MPIELLSSVRNRMLAEDVPHESAGVRSLLPGANRLFVIAVVAILAGCSRSTPTPSTQPDRHAEAIKQAFDQDRIAGNKFKQDVKVDRLAAARAYVQALRGVDLRSCPHDFQEAFLKHRYAWDELVPHLEKYAGFSGDLLALLEFGSAVIAKRSLTTDGELEFERIRKGITSTYFEVEKTALRYGVQSQH